MREMGPQEDTQHSEEYRDLKARLDAFEIWDSLDTAGKLAVILQHFPAAEWFHADYLPIIASVRHNPPGKWGEVRAIFKQVGGNPYDLEREVDKLLNEQTSASVPKAGRQLRVTSLATVIPERVNWLWKPYLPQGRPVS